MLRQVSAIFESVSATILKDLEDKIFVARIEFVMLAKS